jgi:protein phosphatase methylesterase 1
MLHLSHTSVVYLCTLRLPQSADTLVADIVAVLNTVFTADHVIVLVGHSLGGALVVRTCATKEVLATVAAVVVMDVVEGTAMAALEHMRGIINSRPARFGSVEAGIEWCYKSKTVRNADSARVSFPPQLAVDPLNAAGWTWRTDLLRTEPHWPGWFQGLSDLFLSVGAAKLLLLAGTDRLDKSLMIGQMQGKFQLVVLPAVGHTVQEDAPDKVWQRVSCPSAVPVFVSALTRGA